MAESTPINHASFEEFRVNSSTESLAEYSADINDGQEPDVPNNGNGSHSKETLSLEDKLQKHRTNELFKRSKAGDQLARERLIEMFMPLAQYIARKYDRGTEPLEDLMQVASLALVKAVDGFRLDNGTAFSSYAVPTITGEIKRHYRDKTWTMHVPRSLKELVLRVDKALSELKQTNQGDPTPMQIADKLNVTEKEAIEALQVLQSRFTKSFDEPVVYSDGDEYVLGDMIEDPRSEAEISGDLRLQRMDVQRVLPKLGSVLQTIIMGKIEDKTQKEIGAEVGFSQMHVSRNLRRATELLSEHLDVDGRHIKYQGES